MTTVPDPLPVLWHIKVSNFNEKARWALDYKQVPHRRVDPLPGAHMALALALTRRVATFPVLQIDGKSIGDTTRIVETLERRFPEPPLYPREEEARKRALELEEFFDENLGPDVRRIVFCELLKHPEILKARAAEMTTRRQGKMLARGLPAFSVVLRMRYGTSDEAAAQSLLRVRAAMRLIEDLLAGGEHLVGEEFTIADLTAAALLGPLLAPPQLPYRNPDVPLPARLEEIVDELTALPAGQWVMRTYARYRPPSAEVDLPPEPPRSQLEHEALVG